MDYLHFKQTHLHQCSHVCGCMDVNQPVCVMCSILGSVGRNCSTARLSYIMRVRQGERYLERYPWFEKSPLGESTVIIAMAS
jgi:hypothetical protein